VGPQEKGLLVNGTMMISAKRGSQWDRCQIRVHRKGEWVHKIFFDK
jgi:hypothetical protein